MHLKELKVTGFKSFAKKSELEFTTPITAIVGPNGSGKSNVAEAFRFVLGEQSIKSMRGKKGEDLIFNGSESVSRSNRASVSVTLLNPLKNGKRVFPIDFDEITVERVVNRDGSNEYSVNGSKTRLKDIQELLAVANIGPSGHHIISQGEADRILTSNPKERREMIEDALGLKVYQFKKIESEKKLRKTLKNIEQVESLRREVAPHLRFLERQLKKLERSLKLQEELKDVYAEYLKREDTYLAFHTDKLTQERLVPAERLEELTESVVRAKEKIATHEKNETSDALVSLETRMTESRKERQEFAREMGQLEGQILFTERQITEKKKQQEKEDEIPIPRDEFQKVYDQVEKSVEHARSKKDPKDFVRVLDDVLGSLRSLLKRAFTTSETKEYKILEEEHESLLEEKERLESNIKKFTDKEVELQEEYNQLKKKIESENTENIEAEREIFALMTEQRELEQKIDVIDRELRTLERDRMEFKTELQEAATLLGSAAGMYFEYEVKDKEGEPISQDDVVSEDREVQYTRRRELERMKIRLEELGMGKNDEIIKEHKEVKERDEFLVREIADLSESVQKLENLIADLVKELDIQFVSGIEKISNEFQNFFTLMFGGGHAELQRVKPKVKKKRDDADIELEDGSEYYEEEDEEAEEGIEIDVRLPNKRVRGLDMLSGGERALTSIALIFAMSQVNPPLFVILDETDAALDEANSKRYGDMITELAQKSQLILITHNRETMGRAGVLYGVTMAGDGVSRLLSVKFDEALAVAK